METLNTRLGDVPANTPAVLLIGGRIALVGTYDMGAASDDVVDVGLLVPSCTCLESSHTGECPRCDPETPADLLELVAQAIAESRRVAPDTDDLPIIAGATAQDVVAAAAVLAVLLRPGRNGILP